MKRWQCKYCESDNELDVFTCVNCGNESPALVALSHSEDLHSSEPVFSIKWKINNSDYVIIDNGIGEVKPEGESLLKITKNIILHISAKNQFAERIFQLKLNLPKPTIEIFTVDNEFIEYGKPSLFSWKVRNVEKVVLTEFGDVTDFNTKEITLDASKKIVLSAENAGGKVTKSIKLTLPKPEIIFFNTEKDSIIEGEETILRWHIKNAETVEINKIGKVEEIKIGEIRITPKSKSRFTIIAKNSSGETTKDLVIEVEPRPLIEYFNASNDKVLKNSIINFTWASKNTSKVYLFLGTEKIDVSELTEYPFALQESVSFKLVAYSVSGKCEISKTVIISVIENVKIVSFVADKLFTIQSKPIELSWNVKNANLIKITPDVGEVTAKKKIIVNPDRKITYTLEASNELTKLTQTLTIDVLPLPTISALKLADVPKFHLTAPKINLDGNPLSLKKSPENSKFWRRLLSSKHPEIKKSKFGFLEFKSQSGLTGINSQSPFYLFKNILNQQNLNFETLFLIIRKKINNNL